MALASLILWCLGSYYCQNGMLFCLEHSLKNDTTSEVLQLYLLFLAVVSIILLDVCVGLSKYYERPDVVSFEGHTNASN